MQAPEIYYIIKTKKELIDLKVKGEIKNKTIVLDYNDSKIQIPKDNLIPNKRDEETGIFATCMLPKPQNKNRKPANKLYLALTDINPVFFSDETRREYEHKLRKKANEKARIEQMIKEAKAFREEVPEDVRRVRWEPIEGFEGYFVSPYGEIKQVIKKRKGDAEEIILEPRAYKGGYKILLIRKDKKYIFYVKDIVMNAYIIKPKAKGLLACHLNLNKFDDRICNLAWNTKKVFEERMKEKTKRDKHENSV